MISNLPFKTTLADLLGALEASSCGQFDLVYLPWDGQRGLCRGIAFVNLNSTEHASEFVAKWDRRLWKGNILRLGEARIQGLSALLDEHRPILDGPPENRAPRLHVVLAQDAAEPQ